MLGMTEERTTLTSQDNGITDDTSAGTDPVAELRARTIAALTTARAALDQLHAERATIERDRSRAETQIANAKRAIGELRERSATNDVATREAARTLERLEQGANVFDPARSVRVKRSTK
jgi:chromosome segregation ATPase